MHATRLHPENKARLTVVCQLPIDVAEETGGALFNAGALEISSSAFVENMAMDGGLAIQNVELTSNVVLWNVTFEDNRLECPSLTYSYTRDVSKVISRPCADREFQLCAGLMYGESLFFSVLSTLAC